MEKAVPCSTLEWPHKFHMIPKQKTTTLGQGPVNLNKRITFAASTLDVKKNWISAIKDKQSRLNPTGVEADAGKNYQFVLKTFQSPEFCNVTQMVLPGLYLQGLQVRKKTVSDSTLIKTYKIDCKEVKTFLEKERLGENRSREKALEHLMSHSMKINGSASKTERLEKSKSLYNSNSSLTSGFASSQSDLENNISRNAGNLNYQVPFKQRLDDFDWYVPKCDRNTVDKYLPKDNRLKNGAFLVRSSRATNYALSVVYNRDKNTSIDLKNQRHLKHISINEIKNSDDEVEYYYINTREDEGGKFSSILELIEYYLNKPLSEHFQDLDTCLVDVFEDEDGLGNRESSSSVRYSHRNSDNASIISRTESARTITNPPSITRSPTRSRTFRQPTHSVHVNSNSSSSSHNLPIPNEPISSDPVWNDQTMFDVQTIPRAGGQTYRVLGYCQGVHQWTAQDNNQFSVALGNIFCIVGTASQGWLQSKLKSAENLIILEVIL